MKLQHMLVTIACSTIVFFGGFVGTASADTVDVLVEQLRAKGVISEEEYQSLKSVSGYEKEKAAKMDSKMQKLEKKMKGKKKKKYPSTKMEGRMMLDYRDHSPDATADLKGKPSPAIDIRRARLGTKVKLADNIKGEVVLDISEDGAELDSAKMAYKLPNKMSMVFGKTKVPFSLEEMTSSRWIDFQERSLANAYGGIGKNPSIGLVGKLGDVGGFYLAYASQETKDDQEGKITALRATANFGTPKESVFHIGLGITQGDRAEGGVDRTYAGRGQRFFKADDIDTASGEYEHARQGLELAVALGSFKAQYETITTNYSGVEATTNPGSFDKDIVTSYLNLMYMVTGEQYAKAYKTSSGKFDKIKPINKDKGAIEIGVRFASFDGSDFDAGNGPRLTSGYTSEADSTTYGLKWIPTTNVRFLINYQVTDYETAVTSVDSEKKEKTWLTRAQFSF